MSESQFAGTWSVTKPGRLKGLQDFTIEQSPQTGRFTITAAGLHLPDLVYDPQEDVLLGSCQGEIGGVLGTYNVAVVKYEIPSGFKCKGIIFSTGSGQRDGEDNSVGTWTADKKGSPGLPPPGY